MATSSECPETAEEERVTTDNPRWRMWKNIIALSVSMMFLFTAFSGLTNLQSSINQDENIGVISLSVLYLTFVCSCLFLPPLVISRLGCKYTLVVSTFGYISYALAQLHPTWKTLVCAATLVGLSASTLWSSQSTYITTSARTYATLSNQNSEAVISKFFSVFNMILFTNKIWGNLISSLVLTHTPKPAVHNSSLTISCGAQFCPIENSQIILCPPRRKVVLLNSIYIPVSCIPVVILMLLVDRVKMPTTERNVLQLLTSSWSVMKQRKSLLLIPFTLFVSLEAAFTAADFNQAYVSCMLGVDKVGLIMICNGVTMTISSSLMAKFISLTSRSCVLLATSSLQLALLVIMRFYQPQDNGKSTMYILFAIIAARGACDGIWQTLVQVLYGIAFPDENASAFSVLNVWLSLGYVAAYGYSGFLCMELKIYIVIAMLALGLCGCLLLEFDLRSESIDTKNDSKIEKEFLCRDT